LGVRIKFGTEGFHGLAPLDALILGHDQHHAITPHRGGHGQGNAGITGGRFNQRVARLDFAPRFSTQDHRERGPILNRPSGVIAFELDQDHIVASSILRSRASA
jgi:hypothetical protein